jgi:hypothetical protein
LGQAEEVAEPAFVAVMRPMPAMLVQSLVVADTMAADVVRRRVKPWERLDRWKDDILEQLLMAM